ncbi:hypothetical protein BBJ13_23705 [Escherichia coli]|nr:hypothetical protein BBJ13_23705 [Escherichia coli]PBU05630.1 hypothetical protein BBJ22_06725 [Escherichia coli]PBU15250.1 hypothetical protein BBJ24_06600 [Escherichia coli]
MLLNLSIAFQTSILAVVVTCAGESEGVELYTDEGNDSNLLIVFYVQIMPDDFVMQLHRF